MEMETLVKDIIYRGFDENVNWKGSILLHIVMSRIIDESICCKDTKTVFPQELPQVNRGKN